MDRRIIYCNKDFFEQLETYLQVDERFWDEEVDDISLVFFSADAGKRIIFVPEKDNDGT